jgi:hypothetical protein
MPKNIPIPSQAELREAFDYDADTGELRWRVPPKKGKAKPGDVAGCIQSEEHPYLLVCLRYKLYRVHRLIWMWVYGEDPGPMEIDHKDRDPSNNRIDNLRKAVRQQQTFNTGLRSDNTSGIKGVRWASEKQAWVAQIHSQGKGRTLGYFDSKEGAAAAYQAAAAELHGSFLIQELHTPIKAPETDRHVRARRDSVSGLRGVSPYGSRWRARITHEGKRRVIGYFDTPEEASRAYNQAMEAQK